MKSNVFFTEVVTKLAHNSAVFCEKANKLDDEAVSLLKQNKLSINDIYRFCHFVKKLTGLVKRYKFEDELLSKKEFKAKFPGLASTNEGREKEQQKYEKHVQRLFKRNYKLVKKFMKDELKQSTGRNVKIEAFLCGLTKGDMNDEAMYDLFKNFCDQAYGL